MQAFPIHVPGNYSHKKLRAVAEALKNTGIFTKDTLIPVSFVLALVGPIFWGAQLSARVENLEAKQSQNITKEVFELNMKNFEIKLDAVLDALGKNKAK